MTTSTERELLQSTVDEVEKKLVAMFINLIKTRRPIIIDKTLKEMKKAAIKSFDISEDFLAENKQGSESENLMNNVIPIALQTELSPRKLHTYFYGWKELARYLRVTVRTLQRWDQELKIPWDKSHVGKNGRVRIHVGVADKYYALLKEVRLNS